MTEAAISGSIAKKYKEEQEKREKRKQEHEAKVAAAEVALAAAALKEANAAKRERSNSLSSGNSTPPSRLTDQSATSAAAAAGALPASSSSTSTAAAASSSSSSSSNSAAVVPAKSSLLSECSNEEDWSIESYENLRPVWHDAMQAYVLHFDHHRVREKSVKNFKLVRKVPDPANPGSTIQQTVLQFGRVHDRSVFVMDYAYPLSCVTAFAICLSSIDPKLAV